MSLGTSDVGKAIPFGKEDSEVSYRDEESPRAGTPLPRSSRYRVTIGRWNKFVAALIQYCHSGKSYLECTCYSENISRRKCVGGCIQRIRQVSE